MVTHLVDKIVCKYAVIKRRGATGKLYRSPRIYLPTKLTEDSSFPFREGEQVYVRIVDRRLIIERLPKRIREILVGEQVSAEIAPSSADREST